MTDPNHKPGDIVNGHRLTEQPDGSLAWLPVNADSQYKPGDIANGHRLTQKDDGTYEWVPVQPEQGKKSNKKTLLIAGGVLAGVLLISGIGNALSGGGSDVETTANDEPVAVQEVDDIEPEPEPEPVMVVVPDVIGKTVTDARYDLNVAGVKPSTSNNGDATVTGTDPAAGVEVGKGTVITITAEEKPKLTLEQENALEQAASYLEYSSFSRQGLIDQMSSEYGSGYPVDVATWAVDYLNPDWNAQAVEQAKSYLEYSSFSRDGLYEQLTSAYGSQFTPEQANHALAAIGY